MTVRFKKLKASVSTPAYAYGGDACFDLAVAIDNKDMKPMSVAGGVFAPLDAAVDKAGRCSFVVRPCEHIVFHTGLAFEIPEGHVMLVYARSSTGIKSHLALSNGTGVIDSGYRGEVRVALTNTGIYPVKVTDGDRLAQALIVPYPSVELVQADRLTNTQRGTGGIGSSGR